MVSVSEKFLTVRSEQSQNPIKAVKFNYVNMAPGPKREIEH